MKSSRSTADRIRPILQAMERSIETARRRRLHDADGPARPRHATIEPAEEGNGEPTRRKARPKRSAPPMRQYEGDYRAEAV